jgi:hypothetical protein
VIDPAIVFAVACDAALSPPKTMPYSAPHRPPKKVSIVVVNDFSPTRKAQFEQ